MRLLIKNATIVCPTTGIHENTDVQIDNGTIRAVEKNIAVNDCSVIDATGKHLFPGFIDMHCHLREPGFEYKETLESGMRAAVKGGFTTLASMPNTRPVTDNKLTVEYIINRCKQLDICKILPVAAITKGQDGAELSNIGSLKTAGAVAISDDGQPVSNPALMLRALEYAGMFDINILSHSEEKALSGDGVMNEGLTASVLGLKGIPAIAEELAVARDIILAKSCQASLHIMHVSTAGSAAIIRAAKQRGAKVTAETCPHYLLLDDSACENFNTFAKVNPPLRTPADIAALIAALQDGTIDVIATDHAPHSEDEKICEFVNAAFGISGLETAFAAIYTTLVLPGHLTLQELTRKITAAPAKILGIPVPSITPGAAADITIADLSTRWVVNRHEFVSSGKNTPLHGRELQGQITTTIVNGKIKYRI